MSYLKLTEEEIKRCKTNCLLNEILVVPKGTEDVGENEYHELKSEEIRNQKNIRLNKEQCILALRFPSPDDFDALLEMGRFFESPWVLTRNRGFDGCFMVDVSSYERRLDHQYFKRLLSYIRENPEMVFLLLMRTDSSSVVEKLSNMIGTIRICMTTWLHPSNDRLFQYVENRLLEEGRVVNKQFLTAFLKDKTDYSALDRFVDYYKNNDCIDMDYLNISLSVSKTHKEMGY